MEDLFDKMNKAHRNMKKAAKTCESLSDNDTLDHWNETDKQKMKMLMTKLVVPTGMRLRVTVSECVSKCGFLD